MPVYKNEQLNTWYCKFYYKDWQGNRRQKKKEGFKTQREAKAFERDFLHKEEGSCDMAFGSLVELYLEDCQSRLKPTTLSNKEYMFKQKILPFFKDMPINTINATTVRKWQNELLADENKYSPTYLKTINNQLSAIFNFAVKYYQLPSNPARTCGSIGKKNADSMQFWTMEEFNQFMEIVQYKPVSKVVFPLLFWTGIRSGELLALTLNDFDFDNCILNVNKNYARLDGKDLILDPKTPKSKRLINLPPFLCDLVKEYVAMLYDYQPNERLFTISKHYIRHEMNRGCQQSGVKRIRTHDLRHPYVKL